MADGMAKEPRVPAGDRKFRPDIEGVRAISSVTVMLYHAGISWMAGGFTGVDVFYVLSGFLVTLGLLREAENRGNINFFDFMGRRFRRLLPVSALVIIVTVLATYYWMGPTFGNTTAKDAIWTSGFMANWRFINVGTDYLGAQGAASPLQHYWTLAVEGQFYIAWPLIMLVLAFIARKLTNLSVRTITGIVLVVMFVVSYWWSITSTESEATIAYFSTFTRAWEIAAGCLLAVFLPRILYIPRAIGTWLMIGGIALIIASCFIIQADTPFPGWIAILPVGGASAVIMGGSVAANSWIDRFLAIKPLQLLGKYSYGMYLWHWPMLQIGPSAIGRDLTLPEKLFVLVLATGLAAITYHLIENPMRNLNVLKKNPPQWSWAFGALLIALPIALSVQQIQANEEAAPITITEAAQSEYPNETEVLAEVQASVDVDEWPEQAPRIDNPAYSDECDVSRAATSSSACVHGDPNGSRTAVIYGDSHAAMWIPAFDLIGKSNDWKIIQLNKPGCVAPDFPTYSNVLGREYTECIEYRAWAIDKIAEISPDLVVITNAYDGSLRSTGSEGTSDGVPEAWEEGLGKTLDAITPHADRVIVLGDQAYPSQAGINCLEANPSDVTKCGDAFDDAVHADHNAMEARVAEEHGAEYVDIVPWMCTDDFCPAVIGDITVHRDRMHINETFAIYLAEVLGNATGMIDGDLTNPSSGNEGIRPNVSLGQKIIRYPEGLFTFYLAGV